MLASRETWWHAGPGQMRIIFIAIVLFALLTLYLPGEVAAQPQVACSPPICSVSFSRVVMTNDWGTTIMNDTVTLNSTSAVSFVTLGLPLPIANNLRHMTAVDSQGTMVQTEALAANQTGNYRLFKFNFSPKTGVYRFKVSSALSGLLSLASGLYTFTFGAFPVVDKAVNITKAQVDVNTGDWPLPHYFPGNITVNPGHFRANATLPFEAFNSTVSTIVFQSTGTNQNIFDVSASRTIMISQTGGMSVFDSYNITNRGKKVSSIRFTVPENASTITARDLIGQLDQSKIVILTSPNAPTNVTFTPRFSSVDTSGSVTVVLKYDLAGSYLTANSLGRYTLNFQMFNNVKFFQPVFITKIIVPTGFRKETLPVQTQAFSGDTVTLQASSINPLTDLSFSMTFQLDPFWAGYAPLSWATLVEAALVIVALVVSSGPRASGIVPSQLMGRFADLYDEKSAMRMEGDKMDEDLGRGAINKNEYKKRRRLIDLRFSEIEKSLQPVKEELVSVQGRYRDLLKRIDRAEAELQQVKSSLNDLKNQYRSGRVSKDLYDSLLFDLQKRKERTQRTIDNIIIGLREEAR